MDIPVVSALQLASAPACAHARSCPISHTPCPGECVYADIMESVHLGVAVFDLKTPSLLFLNRAGQELFRKQDRPADYAALVELMFPPGVAPLDLPLEYQGDPLHLGTRLIGYTLYRSKEIAWTFFRDITEKQRLESIAEAVETMNNIGTIFSAVRHELGNPINSVKAALSVLRYNLDSFPRPVLEEYLDRIGSELSRVEVLLRSLRSFSMYEQLELMPVDLPTFLDSFAALARPGLERRGIQLVLEKESGCAAKADPRALQQALLNLVANAADAVEGLAEPRITVTARCVDGLARLTVSDTGVGMDADQVSRAFKPFHTTKANGTGLGLTITRKLLLKMGGTVGLKSKQGEGTQVHLTLPLIGCGVSA
jgi:signal transduction histidine kinase